MKRIQMLGYIFKYEKELKRLKVPSGGWEPKGTVVLGCLSREDALLFAAFLARKIRLILHEGKRPRTLHRDFGFLQGVLSLAGVYTIEEVLSDT